MKEVRSIKRDYSFIPYGKTSEYKQYGDTVQAYEHLCPFCGEVHSAKTIIAKSLDLHHSEEKTYNQISKCHCAWAELMNSMPPIYAMCANCIFYKKGKCTNQKEIKEIEELLDIFEVKVDELSVRDERASCKYHELDYNIFTTLFKDNKTE